jgi:peptide-methionine (S)-S-oxide reductase
MSTIILGGGCFWCIEAIFSGLKGVNKVQSGYIGGTTSNPDYDSICSGTTGHAEAVAIEWDEAILPLSVVLDIFFTSHDPTTLNRQGADIGTQYRSVIYFTEDSQKEAAQSKIAELNQEQVFDKPIVTTVEPAGVFYVAEDYHQGYYQLNQNKGYCQVVISPKLQKLRKQYAPWLK